MTDWNKPRGYLWRKIMFEQSFVLLFALKKLGNLYHWYPLPSTGPVKTTQLYPPLHWSSQEIGRQHSEHADLHKGILQMNRSQYKCRLGTLEDNFVLLGILVITSSYHVITSSNHIITFQILDHFPTLPTLIKIPNTKRWNQCDSWYSA